MCDNLSAVYLSANPALHKRSKHFDTDYHYIREQVALGLIETQHISAAQQAADIFTKSLPKQAFQQLRSKFGVGPPPISSLRGDVRHMGQATREAHASDIVKPINEDKRVRRTEKEQRLLLDLLTPLLSTSEG